MNFLLLCFYLFYFTCTFGHSNFSFPIYLTKIFSIRDRYYLTTTIVINKKEYNVIIDTGSETTFLISKCHEKTCKIPIYKLNITKAISKLNLSQSYSGGDKVYGPLVQEKIKLRGMENEYSADVWILSALEYEKGNYIKSGLSGLLAMACQKSSWVLCFISNLRNISKQITFLPIRGNNGCAIVGDFDKSLIKNVITLPDVSRSNNFTPIWAVDGNLSLKSSTNNIFQSSKSVIIFDTGLNVPSATFRSFEEVLNKTIPPDAKFVPYTGKYLAQYKCDNCTNINLPVFKFCFTSNTDSLCLELTETQYILKQKGYCHVLIKQNEFKGGNIYVVGLHVIKRIAIGYDYDNFQLFLGFSASAFYTKSGKGGCIIRNERVIQKVLHYKCRKKMTVNNKTVLKVTKQKKNLKLKTRKKGKL